MGGGSNKGSGNCKYGSGGLHEGDEDGNSCADCRSGYSDGCVGEEAGCDIGGGGCRR